MKEISFTSIRKLVVLILISLLVNLSMFMQIQSVSSAIPHYDVNSDGQCNILDFIQIANRLGESGSPGWIREDVDKNGIIDIFDIIYVSNHYGESGWTNDIGRIKKLSIAYGSAMGNTANQEFIASHFDMLDCPRSYHAAAANVKSLNPDIKILGYYDATMMSSDYPDWNYVNQFEEWFVHDIHGNRVQPTSYPNNYLMNPDSGWSNYFAQQCKEFLTKYPQFDGIFADDVPTDLYHDGYRFTVPYSDFSPGILTNWGSGMLQQIQNTQNTIGSKVLMPNAYKHMQYCQDDTQVHFWENFIH